ncbi:MAG TPA: agmatine deiminase family protein [Firmicutes bacterium]|nr:agmatine deiminase family protein [Bacillota bacterium]
MYPSELGFMMPAEWERHRQTFMEWPLKEAEWPGPFQEILSGFTNIAKKIAAFEQVTVITSPASTKEAAVYLYDTPTPNPIQLLEIEHNDSWIRDNGPTFVVNPQKEIAGINWKFNAWGGKYRFTEDDQVAPELLAHLKIPKFDAPLVLEGGSIHVDGDGTLLTTEECLLNQNRNPHLSKTEIEELLQGYLGIQKVIWLPRGLYGDDTDGHIDNVACFARPGVVIMQDCSDPRDPNYPIACENRRILESATDARGRKLEVIRIEQPPPIEYNGTRLILSYLNFSFVNCGLILPVFGRTLRTKDPSLPRDLRKETLKTDAVAEMTLKQIFPQRLVATVDGLQVARGGGNVHCLTQQMPAP